MIRSHQLEGIVIKRTNYSEVDRIITIFTRNEGKILVLGKGIRKINSRKAPHLELFNQCQFTLITGRNMDLVTESQTINAFSSIRNNLLKLAYAYQMAEIIDKIIPEKENYQKIYLLFIETLRQIDKGQNTCVLDLTQQFILEVLWDLGYLPVSTMVKNHNLRVFLENIMERTLKSDSLLTKITQNLKHSIPHV